MPLKISSSQRINALVFITFLALLFPLILFVYNPLAYKVLRNRRHLQIEKRRLDSYRLEVSEAKQIAQENEILEKELKKYSGVKIEKVTSSILKSLLKASKRSNVEFISIDPIDVLDKNDFKYIKLQVQAKSGFHEIGYFFSEIRRLNGLFFIDNIELSCKDRTSNEIISKMEMSVYFPTSKN